MLALLRCAPKCQASKRGFTLIELLVVIAVVGILISIAVVSFNLIRDDRGIQRQALQLSSLIDMASDEAQMQIRVATRPADPNVKNWKAGGYVDRVPNDPWGHTYLYLNPGINEEIDIYTLGRDGQPGGEGIDADIGNWTLD